MCVFVLLQDNKHNAIKTKLQFLKGSYESVGESLLRIWTLRHRI